MVASVGDVELSPLLCRYRPDNLVSCEFLLAKLLFADDHQLIHCLQLGIEALTRESVAVEWFTGIRRRDDVRRRQRGRWGNIRI